MASLEAVLRVRRATVDAGSTQPKRKVIGGEPEVPARSADKATLVPLKGTGVSNDRRASRGVSEPHTACFCPKA